jgi:iron complex transport system ATP-binding protein|tara:strand:- start:2835 stop:3608 length:774 start_codon:yes stop_codon:yes gene_type:complete
VTKLSLSNIGLSITSKVILESINLELNSGELVVLLGANGAGKSSVLRSALGLVPVSTGESLIDEQLVTTLSSANRAKKVAYLPQKRPLAWPIKVFDVVSLGRYAFGVNLGRLKNDDLELVESAITNCGLEQLRNRRVDTLSGGEAARVHVARAFAANAALLLADEPTAALDPKHQLDVMQLIRRYVDMGGGALVVGHEASLAARFADRLVWMRDGGIIADGTVKETMTAAMMAEIYGVSAQIGEVAGHINVSIIDSL